MNNSYRKSQASRNATHLDTGRLMTPCVFGSKLVQIGARPPFGTGLVPNRDLAGTKSRAKRLRATTSFMTNPPRASTHNPPVLQRGPNERQVWEIIPDSLRPAAEQAVDWRSNKHGFVEASVDVVQPREAFVVEVGVAAFDFTLKALNPSAQGRRVSRRTLGLLCPLQSTLKVSQKLYHSA